eukprot:7445796-Pyramimonas_sp.AAC.1
MATPPPPGKGDRERARAEAKGGVAQQSRVRFGAEGGSPKTPADLRKSRDDARMTAPMSPSSSRQSRKVCRKPAYFFQEQEVHPHH